MLVISQNLVLSPAEAALPDGVPLILYENKVTRTNVTATSEDSDYPITNVANVATNQEWRSVDDATPLPTTIDQLGRHGRWRRDCAAQSRQRRHPGLDPQGDGG
jgi:hypothetical protein